ncbi:hypothetical protein HanRHA438_Chr07g0288711 [Helianthus annuus]|nr:hypothetical protein HanHA89_Chr07g0245571 [Helianthus annuus]KAJ0638760.1 hypothetical protein HanHA300_Chr00c0049g0699671 [Helianthus annuus]KAJ0730137.1 hypothetical protein HanOQP8_Chr07g0236571 [Helianthus annuus]KAJ0906554.1 hypothetical protein HanRHA438_Chr07g0288711 [Helianthus annuus]
MRHAEGVQVSPAMRGRVPTRENHLKRLNRVLKIPFNTLPFETNPERPIGYFLSFFTPFKLFLHV